MVFEIRREIPEFLGITREHLGNAQAGVTWLSMVVCLGLAMDQ